MRVQKGGPVRREHFKILILGGGAGGISLAAKLKQTMQASEIAIVEPSEQHFYQPLWTLVGAGLVDLKTTERSTRDLIPRGVNWIKESVLKVDPRQSEVYLTHELKVGYDVLVVATGLRLKWESIEGLGDSLGHNGIHTVYEREFAPGTAQALQSFKGGTAIFVMPPVPIKCAGAPQKIMYLAENIFRLNGVRHKSRLIFATAGKAMFGIPEFGNALAKIAKEKGIEPLFGHKIKGVHPSERKVEFEVAGLDGAPESVQLSYDFLHLVPPMTAHSFVAESGLAAESGEQKGWLEVDKFSLQHLKYPNVFGIGDVTGVPNSKTGAAVRSQYPVVAENISSFLKGKKCEARYNGYSSCPLITEIGKVMLAEFGYDGKLMPSFPLNPTIPRRTMWYLKKDLLPQLYWHGMLKGRV